MEHKVILLIDDDYLDIESVKRALKKREILHTLHVAHNGVDALAMLTDNFGDYKHFLPDVILLDIDMPKMNGIEFLRIIKNYYNLKNIKIFIMANSVEEYSVLSVQNLGISGYIVKPLVFNEKSQKDTLILLDELEK